MKKLNDKQKKIINIIVTSLQIAIVVLAIVLSAIIIANPNVENAEIGRGRTKLLPVLTNSMAGDKKDSFKKSDLIVAKRPKDASALKIGDIVTYQTKVGGTDVLNTHRIVEVGKIEENGEELTSYVTKGDNTEGLDRAITEKDVLAVYKYHLKGVGGAILWLQKPTNFLLVIVLPLLVLFVYNIILFVRMMMQAKLSKQLQEAGTGTAIDEEEIKRQAIEEYLAAKDASEKPKADIKKEPATKDAPEAPKAGAKKEATTKKASATPKTGVKKEATTKKASVAPKTDVKKKPAEKKLAATTKKDSGTKQ